MKHIICLLLVLSVCFGGIAQTQLDSIQSLDEVVLSDVKLKQYAPGFKIEVLKDSVLRTNAQSLTGLLAFNSNIYFKENGNGMVSSPSFRGTNASQTAVIWNGIPINSQLNGQTDFNTINTTHYNDIAIRSGGGSVQYGSGAIGGSIHLNNTLLFKPHFDTTMRLGYGSYDTKTGSVSSAIGSDRWSVNVGLAYNASENDYPYLGTTKKNVNGAYNNLDLNLNLGYFISDNDVLKLYHQHFIGNRDFSGTVATPSQSHYEDKNYRSLIEWSHLAKAFNYQLKVAHLQEHFKYFGTQSTSNFSYGKVNTLIVKPSFNFRFSRKIKLQTSVDYTKYDAEGTSFGTPSRSNVSATALLNHKVSRAFSYGVNLRKDFTSTFSNPLVFSVDTEYAVTKHYSLQLNGSRNYRVPTFNDLYWQPGGNLDLIPESSYQVDLGQQLSFGFAQLKLNGYFIKTSELIVWKPNSIGLWSPVNIASTQSYGAEIEGHAEVHFKSHYFKLDGHYSYTVSEDTNTKKQLIYVPFHKANFSIAYSYKKLALFFQHAFNGDVFTTEDNLKGRLTSLPSYDVSNLGLEYSLYNKGNNTLSLGGTINNVFNKSYQSVAFRPMPNRNFNIQLHYKF
ncbi:TonB-dependent receptor plug domain-containing protein [Bizionia paragorgiae]|uniref:Iron complex outermembrane recepter protein n=1 Tax=Bizionia paragorgiae TaxID=283786 RepID=A0A1H3YAZ1_BIZPA|nr:TonB-dependent receptor [Bizionia paragorgiae]SEA08144.1 iron complex outermembrane recepter protein [Bizionia paragorgiae]